MPQDMFIKIAQIEGESTDDKHKNEIEVLSYAWGVSHRETGSRSSGGYATGERADHAGFTFTKTIDKASTKLFEKACDGTSIPTVVFSCHRATGEKQLFLQIDMTNCLVKNVSTLVAGLGSEKYVPGENVLPLETVTLAYDTIKYEYTVTDHSTGKPTGKVSYGWSLTKNAKL